MLSRYQGKKIRITTEGGTVFSGTAEVYPSGYGLHEFGCAEESIMIEDTIIFHSDIKKIEVLTDSVHSPMNLYSSCNLIAKSDMASVVDSLTAPLSVINALVVALCMKKRKKLIDTLDSLEKIWDEYQVYDNEEMGYIGDSIKMNYSESEDEDNE